MLDDSTDLSLTELLGSGGEESTSTAPVASPGASATAKRYDDRSLWANLPQPQLREKLMDANARLGQLHLLVATLIRCLIDKGVLDRSELSELMRQIDLEDGRADGQLGKSRKNVPEWCPKCQAKIPPDRASCVICGMTFRGTDYQT